MRREPAYASRTGKATLEAFGAAIARFLGPRSNSEEAFLEFLTAHAVPVVSNGDVAVRSI